jgi:hypothetical protein
MFAFNFKPPQDPHKKDIPVISFKPKDKPKVKKLEVVEEVKEEVKTTEAPKKQVSKVKAPDAPKKQFSKVKEDMTKMEVINEVVEKPKIEEPKPEAPKKKRIVAIVRILKTPIKKKSLKKLHCYHMISGVSKLNS